MNRIIVSVGGLITGVILGVVAGLFFVNANKTVIRKAIPPQIVQEKVIHKAFAKISGSITSVTNEYFTVRNKENEANLYLDFNGVTRLVDSQSGKPIQFQDIQVGDEIVTGGIGVVISTTNPAEKVGRVYAHYLTIKPK